MNPTKIGARESSRISGDATDRRDGAHRASLQFGIWNLDFKSGLHLAPGLFAFIRGSTTLFAIQRKESYA
jgi:hypothetical protein